MAGSNLLFGTLCSGNELLLIQHRFSDVDWLLIFVRLDVNPQRSLHPLFPPILLCIEPREYVRVYLHRNDHFRLIG